MSELRTERCQWGECRERVIWARTENNRPIPLNETPALPGTDRAMVLIGERAYGRVAAVVRLRCMFDVDEAEAYQLALTDYGWYVAHFATCPGAKGHRPRRAPRI